MGGVYPISAPSSRFCSEGRNRTSLNEHTFFTEVSGSIVYRTLLFFYSSCSIRNYLRSSPTCNHLLLHYILNKIEKHSRKILLEHCSSFEVMQVCLLLSYLTSSKNTYFSLYNKRIFRNTL